MLKNTSTKVETNVKELNDSTLTQGKDTFLTLVAKALHIVMFLVLGFASLFPYFTKVKHLKVLLSIYLFVSACILDVQLSVLQVVESAVSLASNIFGSCCWIREHFVTLVLAGLWYQVTPIFNFIDHVETYIRNVSEEQHRSQVESTPVVDKEIQQPEHISPTSSSAGSFVSTPASSPQSTPVSTRVNPYIRITSASAFEEDLSDTDNESVGNLIVRKPSLMVATVTRSRTPSSTSLLVRSASIKHLGAIPTPTPTPTIRKKLSTASRASLKPIKALETTLGAASATTEFQRVGRSVVGAPLPQLTLQNVEKKQGKVAKVAKKWVGKVKAMAKVGKKGKGGGDAIVV